MSVKSVEKQIIEENKSKRRASLGLYITPNHVFSYQGISDFIYTGVRGVGKSVFTVETAIILKRKYGYENVRFYYFRLTDLSIKSLLANNAEKAIDPYLVNKYNMEITKKGNIVYDHGKKLVEFLPLVSAGSKGKGVNLYDCNWFDGKKKRYIVTLWDEFLAMDGVEKKSIGDPVSQYRIYREAIFRDAERQPYNAVYNFMVANNVSDCANVTGALYNYIPNPNCFNRVKLTRKHALFWNIPVTGEYLDKRKKSYNASTNDYNNDPNYCNVKRDLSLIKPTKTRIYKVTMLIKFDKYDKTKWFAVYDNKYIRQYKSESVKEDKIIPMKRYLDNLFSPELVTMVFDRYDARSFMYVDLISMSLFQTQLKLIKTK